MKYLLVLLWAVRAFAGPGVWTSLGPGGGWARSLVVDPRSPSTLYATGDGGVYRSVDAGENWTALGPAVVLGTPQSLAMDAADSNTLYLAVRGSGVWKSSDAGNNWTLQTSGLPDLLLNNMVADPLNGGVVYAAAGSGLYKSVDASAHWARILDGMALSVTVDPVDSRKVYMIGAQGVMKSRDSGATWTPANNGLGRDVGSTALAVDPSHPSTLLYSAPCTGLYRSTDEAATWTSVTPGGPPSSCTTQVLSMAFDPRNSSIVYAGFVSAGIRTGSGGMIKSVDGGATWRPLALPVEGFFWFTSIIFDPRDSATVYITGFNSMFRTTDAGDSWKPINSRMNGTRVDTFLVDPASPKTLYAHGDSLYRSNDLGQSWTRIVPPVDLGSVAIGADSALYVAQFPTGKMRVVRTTDGGQSWTEASAGLPDCCGSISGLVADPRYPAILYVAVRGGGPQNAAIYRTDDGARSWTHGVPAPRGGGFHTVAVDPAGALYASNELGIYRSLSSGNGWEILPAPLGLVSVFALHPRRPGVVYLASPCASAACDGNSGVMRSADGGATWEPLPNLPVKGLVTALAIDPASDAVYVGTAGGVFVNATGDSWTPLNTGLTTFGITSLAFHPTDPKLLLAGTLGGGLFSLTLP
jgi:photosystem II stability/assembly factor-like uncharacterized protein